MPIAACRKHEHARSKLLVEFNVLVVHAKVLRSSDLQLAGGVQVKKYIHAVDPRRPGHFVEAVTTPEYQVGHIP